MAYTAISDAEIQPGQPAFSSVIERLRDNPIAIAQGDATVPAANKIVAAAFKQPTSASQTVYLARQGNSQALTDDGIVHQFFHAVVVVAGAYTFAGTTSTTSNTNILIYKNGVLDHTVVSTSFTHAMTLAAGDSVRVDVERTGIGTTTLSDFRFLTEIIVPTAQCQFMRF